MIFVNNFDFLKYAANLGRESNRTYKKICKGYKKSYNARIFIALATNVTIITIYKISVSQA